MDNKTFYGTENNRSLTYLEFGEIDMEAGKKKVWDFKLHQKAYDWLMLGRYSNDLLNFVRMKQDVGRVSLQETIDHYNREIHHDDEASLHLNKLIALAALGDNESGKSFYELGQTIFGCIEGMAFYQEFLKDLDIRLPHQNLKQVHWYGVDISQMFNELARINHGEYQVSTFTDPSLLPPQMGVFFAKGISLLYAVRDIPQLFETLNKGRVSIFDYSLALHEDEDTTIGSGKTVRYLKLQDFMKTYRQGERVLYIKKNNSRVISDTNRLWLDCLYTEPALANAYIEADKRLRKELYKNLSPLKDSSRFLDNQEEAHWLNIEDYLQELNIGIE